MWVVVLGVVIQNDYFNLSNPPPQSAQSTVPDEAWAQLPTI
jgi:hypothetical protein